MKNILSIIVVLLGIFSNCYSQTDSIWVEKKSCTDHKIYSGSKLILVAKTKKGKVVSNTYGYGLDYFVALPVEKRLKLIGELLQYSSDTSLCCLEFAFYSFNGIEGCGGEPVDNKRYSVVVDALFMINRLCWPKLMDLYSCNPVLWDNETKQSINNSPEKVEIVANRYREWYRECLKLGKVPKYFPFNDGRYVWNGGKKSIVPE